MEFCVLGSGSRGNSVLIESEKTSILLDCGFSGKEIASRLKAIGKDIEKLDAIFVTHEHNDHIGGVGVVSRRCRIPVFANAGTFRAGVSKLGKVFKACEFASGDRVEFQDLEIKSFSISHDTRDPVGYVIGNNAFRIGLCTDTGKISHLMKQRLKGVNGLILEFNHDLEMLARGPYPLALQQRVKSSQGHLANGDAAALLAELMHEGLSHVVLAHLSEINNLPQLARQEALAAVSNEDASKIVLARQDGPTRIFSL